jgi:hypothetical protein
MSPYPIANAAPAPIETEPGPYLSANPPQIPAVTYSPKIAEDARRLSCEDVRCSERARGGAQMGKVEMAAKEAIPPD